MNYTFVNGTIEQQQRWLQAAHLLLNFPFAALPYEIEVEFSTAGVIEAVGHNSIAVTQVTYDSMSAKTIVRNDAPGFGQALRMSLAAEAAALGLRYNADLHFNETVVHELAHVAYGALSHALRVRVAEMFGAKTDLDAVINDQSKDWKDRVVEGIADTFKEAFLPRRHRVFPNRTNRRISYSRYSEFRRFFRGVEGGEDGFQYTYGSSAFRADLSEWGLNARPYHKSSRDDEAFVFFGEIEGYESCWGVDMSQFAESSHHPFSIEPEDEIIS